ncbi:MAG: 2-dehydropantoate 2-reductase [Lachnospiraceae bacterium]|nr:2-dehydropantoate 2-reductase [Lachnospiraceae bacterium]
MRMIENVVLIGAGAVGAYFVQGLMKKPEIGFALAAEGDRKKRLETTGLRINHASLFPAVKTPAEARGADLILIAVKYDAIHEAARMAAEIATKQTIILSLLNGIDSEEIVGAAAGAEHMLYSIMRIQSWREGREILFDPAATAGLFFGEKDTREKTERVRAVEELFAGTEIRCTFVPDMQGEIWNKFASNISRNLPQAMLGVGYGAYEDSVHAAYLRDTMDAEVKAVAEAKGIHIPPMAGKAAAAWQTVDKSARFSTLQDLDAHRHTEVEMFLGELMRMAHEVHVPVPCCAFAYHFIKALEEKNDGRFDYGS